VTRIAPSLFAFAFVTLGARGLHAQLPQLLTTLSPDVTEAGQLQTLKVHGTSGDKVWLLLSGHTGSLDLPGVGTILVGVGPDLSILPLGPIPSSGVLEASCAPGCDSPLLLAPCFMQAFSFDSSSSALTGLGNLQVLQAAGGDCGRCVAEATPDPIHWGVFPAHAFWLPGIGTDFVFVAGGSLVERGNGYAHMSGVIARTSDSNKRFLVDIDMNQALYPGALGYPPSGSPKIELAPQAYYDQGGPVDPQTWHYYQLCDGFLRGMADYEGALLSVQRLGPAVQVGYGANGKNTLLGASGWLDVQVLSQPAQGDALALTGHGDFNVDLLSDCGECALKAVPDPLWSASQYTHSFYLPEIGKDFVFDPAGQYVEYGDGTARLSGTIRRTAKPSKAFQVDVTFAQRVNPGAATFPPPGSPKMSLSPSSYSVNGGPVDPTAWHYFLSIDGVLTGVDDYAGGTLKITRDGPAYQVGYGANDKNLNWGASGWLTVKILTHPTLGSPFPSTLDSGDINIDLVDCP
jgi:hypothetical protein